MPFLFIGIPLAAVILLNILTWSNRRSALWMTMLAAIMQLGLGIYDLVLCLTGDVKVQSTFFGHFTVDLFSAVALCLIGLTVCVTVILAKASLKSSRFVFGSSLLLLMMGMNGVAMVTDIFSLYVFIEVTSASAFLLIGIHKQKDGLEGAFKYFLMSALATIMMLLAIAFLFAMTGETSFEAIAAYIAAQGANYPLALTGAFILFIIALSIKSGVVPFHSWVPDAYAGAPSPVSAVLAGIVTKVSGVYALIRIFRDVFMSNSRLGSVLLVLSMASILVGALGAIGQKDIKRMLAFSSISQVGYIVLGAATGSPLGYIGALMHFFNHAAFKSLLFVDAAVIEERTGTRNMNEMGGLGARMPYTSVSSIVGLLSLAGIPPLSGFWSKLLIIMAVWQVSPGLAVAALLASVLTLGYFLILQKKVFFGKLSPAMEKVTEVSTSVKLVQVVLSAINILAGLLFPLLLMYFQGRGMM